MPAFVIFLTKQFVFLKKIGEVVICYLIGLLLGNIGFLPVGSSKILDVMSTITIPIAIPLLLFSADVRSWISLFRTTLVSMVLAVVCVMVVVVSGFFLFRDFIPELSGISGMLIGVYTGGTPNLAAIKTALGIDSETYILVHTYDLIVSAVFLLFVISIGQKLLNVILPKFKKENFTDPQQKALTINIEGHENYKILFLRKNLSKMLLAFGVSVAIFVSGGGVSLLVPGQFTTMTAIIAITTMGLLFSFVPKINKNELSFPLGMYFILVFSLVVASMAKFENIVSTSPYLFMYVCLSIFGTLILHIIFSYLLKIDTDTVLVSATALILSPPFVPVVAGALNNKHLIISGLTIGIIGYAIGNYLGIFVAWVLKLA